jgi:hypothetical protein
LAAGFVAAGYVLAARASDIAHIFNDYYMFTLNGWPVDVENKTARHVGLVAGQKLGGRKPNVVA